MSEKEHDLKPIEINGKILIDFSRLWIKPQKSSNFSLIQQGINSLSQQYSK